MKIFNHLLFRLSVVIFLFLLILMLPYLVKAESTYELCQCVCEPLTAENSNDVVFPDDEISEEDETENVTDENDNENNDEEVGEEVVEEIIEEDFSNIIVNEIYPSPLSGEEEFIELYNTGENGVDLTGWYLTDESDKKYILSDHFIESKSYVVIYGSESSLILNNSGDTVYLYDKFDNLRQSVSYPVIAKGESLVYNSEQETWQILDNNTAGAENIFTNEINEDVIEEENNNDDEISEEGETENVTDENDNENNDEEVGEEVVEEIIEEDFSNIIVNEIYPSPLSGEEEFIELYNTGENGVDLTGWYLTDESDKKYILSDHFIESKSYVVIYGSESSLILNNSGDTVYLYDKFDNLRQSVSYPVIAKGESLAYNSEQETWQILDDNTAGAENIFTNEINEDVIEEENNNDDEISEEDETENSGDEESVVYKEEVLSNYDSWFDDSQLSVKGKVISASGEWKNNRCYLADHNQAIPILCTKLAAQFNSLDIIKVFGEVVFRNGVFYRFDPDVVEKIDEDIVLEGESLTSSLKPYSLYKYNGIVKDYSDSYNKITLETEDFGDVILRWSKSLEWPVISEGSVINGLGMADEDGNLWLWQQWSEDEVEEVIGGEVLSEEILNNSNSNEEDPQVSVAYLGVGVAGLLGTGKFAWKYKKFLGNIFSKGNFS